MKAQEENISDWGKGGEREQGACGEKKERGGFENSLKNQGGESCGRKGEMMGGDF